MTPDPRSVEEFERAMWTLFDFARAIKALGQPPTDDPQKRDAWLRDLWAAAASVPDEGGTTELENFGRNVADSLGEVRTGLLALQQADEKQNRLYPTNPVPAFQFVNSISNSLNRRSMCTGVHVNGGGCGCSGASLELLYHDRGTDGQGALVQETTAFYPVYITAEADEDGDVIFSQLGEATFP